MNTQEIQKLCTQCKDTIPLIWQEQLCKNCLYDYYDEKNESDEKEVDFIDLGFVMSIYDIDCEHHNTYIDNEGFTVCEDCNEDLF